MAKESKENSLDSVSDVSKVDQVKWKQHIMSINSKKLLDYIRELCNARESLARADEALNRKPKKDKNGNIDPCYYHPLPDKLPASGMMVDDEDVESEMI